MRVLALRDLGNPPVRCTLPAGIHKLTVSVENVGLVNGSMLRGLRELTLDLEAVDDSLFRRLWPWPTREQLPALRCVVACNCSGDALRTAVARACAPLAPLYFATNVVHDVRSDLDCLELVTAP